MYADNTKSWHNNKCKIYFGGSELNFYTVIETYIISLNPKGQISSCKTQILAANLKNALTNKNQKFKEVVSSPKLLWTEASWTL